jgi:hypothetical protein
MAIRKLYLCAAAALFCQIPAAYAIFNISTPGVKEGQLDVELRNRWDFDSDSASQDGYRNHVLKLEYGMNKWWSVEVQGKVEKRQLNEYEYATSDIETKFRLAEPGTLWFDPAVKFAYEWGHTPGQANRARAKLLLEKNMGKWNTVINLNAGKEMGTNATKDTDFDAGWRVKYKLNKYIEPGIEMYNGWGELSRTGDFDDQKHRIGPMFFGEIAPGLKYQLGYLFGLSRGAEDGSVKFFLKYEIPL